MIKSEKRRRITFKLAGCALTMPIRACRFPASISSWLKSLSVGCGSAQAAQRPAKRHWTGELRGCRSDNFCNEQARGDLVAPSSSSHHIPQSSGSKSIELLVWRFGQPGHPWGLRTGPIQEGSQSGPRLDRKARARKGPKAMRKKQACTSSCTVLSPT
eukprot:scaffold19475_cov24-Phaeocystis_antarctica.AAC.1